MRTPVTHQHTRLADKYSAWVFDDWTIQRNAAVAELYYAYGGVVTSELTGWSRPTIMKCVESALAYEASTRRKAK